MRTSSLMTKWGKLPEGMSKADAEAVLQFLYGAFDRQTAKHVEIVHPYIETDEDTSAQTNVTVYEFCRWLEAVAA
jgi:hypothetical protein